MSGVARTAALLLSGGESTRMGGFPKALLPVGSRPAVRRMAEVATAEGFDPVLVVTGSHAEAILPALAGLAVVSVRSARWSEGRTASIQDGLDRVPAEHDVLLWPVDRPFARAATLRALAAAAASDPLGLWFLPTWQGRGGHPVLLRRVLRATIRSLGPDAPLRSLIPGLGPQVVRLPVDDPGVLMNTDTPGEYEQAHAAWQARERGERWTGD